MSITYPTLILTVGDTEITFSGPEVIRANLVQEINPVSVELPSSSLEFSVISYDESFSMFSGAIYSLLSERLPIMAYQTVDGVLQFIGRFYLDSWKNISEYEFEFKAIDLIGTLSTIDYDGGLWLTNTSVSEILKVVLTANNVEYELDPALESVQLRGWIPPSKCREALQQVCFAAKATVYGLQSNKLVIVPTVISTGPYDYKIGNEEKLKAEQIELLPLVTGIELISHSYSEVIGTPEETIYQESLEAGSHKIVFDIPYYGMVIDGPGYTPLLLSTENSDYIVTENGDYIEAGGQYSITSNVIFLELEEAGVVTVTGYPYTDSKRAFIFTEEGLTEYSNKNNYVIDEATLVSVENAESVLNQLRDYYRQRYEQSITLLPSSVVTGDVLFTNTIFSNRILATVHRIDVDLTMGCLQKTIIRGIQPVYVPPAASPVRSARTGLAIAGLDLMENNEWRQYA